MKKNQPSKKQIREILNQSLFDPRNPGPMKAIVETGSADYLVQRSMEFIKESLEIDLGAPDAESHYQECLQRAISLLALARIKTN